MKILISLVIIPPVRCFERNLCHRTLWDLWLFWSKATKHFNFTTISEFVVNKSKDCISRVYVAMDEHAAKKLDVGKNILDLFWRLGDKDPIVRINTCADLLNAVIKKQHEFGNENELCKDLQYSIERLVKGLASARDAARLGYSLFLTEILKNITNVQIEEILELIKKHLTITSKQDTRDLVFGQLFTYTAIIRSKRVPNHAYLAHIVLSLFDLYQGRIYIVNATYKIMLDLFSQLSTKNFKQSIWPQLKTKLPDNWENCSAESLWVLLLCIRMFPDAISSKYLEKHWANEDIFSLGNTKNFRKIIKQTSSTLPMLHPLCSEFLLLAKERKDFAEIWTAVIDDGLFDSDQKDNNSKFIGFEMVKSALHEPEIKTVKIVLSPKFRTVFSKAFLNTTHSLNPAASQLAEFLCNFAKGNAVPDMQVLILKTFLQPPGIILMDEVLKKKEVSLIIQHLLPDAVKEFSGILKEVALKSKESSTDEKVRNLKKIQALIQLGNLVAHPAILTDIEWRMDIIRFLFLHSFFTVKEATSDIPHCEKLYEPLSDSLQDTCINTFYKSVQSLHMRSENNQSPLETFLQQLLILNEYVEVLMNATENVEPKFSIDKIQSSWNHLKKIVHKLSKQSKKDGQVNESNAFQALFLQLGFLLFQDPDHIPEILEELYICCKKALKVRKHEANSDEDGDNEPPWIGVVIDILLSLLSKSSNHLRSMVTYVFPLFCPFIDNNALQQILDVINPQEAEDMLVDESDEEGEANEDVEFGSGTSSDESESEQQANQPVDEEFKKKIQQALGSAAADTDTESVILSDSDMFKLDDVLSQVFKGRKKPGHTLLASEEKTLLNFRVRCFDLIMAYLKSEPPMHLVLMCLEPTLAAFEFGHHSKHQTPLLIKAVSVLHFMAKIKKFQHNNDVSKSELKRLLDTLISKCHKEINISNALKLYSLCIFIVLCYRKLENSDSPSKKKSSKIPSYVKTYLSNLDIFVSSGSSNMLPQFFSNFMEACPDLSWHFIEPCKNYAFSSNIRLFKKTQCLGLLLEALKYSKGQKDITDDQWLEFGENVLPLAIESLKNALDNSEVKPLYITELLNIIFTSHLIIKEKTGKLLLEKYVDLLPLLTENGGNKPYRNAKAKSLRNKIIVCLGGSIKSVKSDSATPNDTEKNFKQEKRKSEEASNHENLVNGDETTQSKKKKQKQKKKNAKQNSELDIIDNSSVNDFNDS